MNYVQVGFGFGFLSGEVRVWVNFGSTMFRSGLGSARVEFGSSMFRVVYGSPVRIWYGSSLIWVGWDSI